MGEVSTIGLDIAKSVFQIHRRHRKVGEGDPCGQHQAGMTAPEVPYLPFGEIDPAGRVKGLTQT
jgi:hypothetical protein